MARTALDCRWYPKRTLRFLTCRPFLSNFNYIGGKLPAISFSVWYRSPKCSEPQIGLLFSDTSASFIVGLPASVTIVLWIKRAPQSFTKSMRLKSFLSLLDIGTSLNTEYVDIVNNTMRKVQRNLQQELLPVHPERVHHPREKRSSALVDELNISRNRAYTE